MKETNENRKMKWYCKKAAAAVMIAAIAAAAFACGAEKEVKEPHLSVWDTGDVYAGERTMTPMPEGWEIVEGFGETEAESGGVVQQAASQDRSISEGDGYYYIYDDNDRKIYSVEEETGEVNLFYEFPYYQYEQAEETDGTEAGMEVYEEGEIWRPRCKLQAYEGSLYVSAYDQAMRVYTEGLFNDSWSLYQPARVALYRLEDGKLQEVQCLAEREEYSYLAFDYLIYEGYVYYWYVISSRTTDYDTWGDGNNCIWRVPLGGTKEEAECIYAWQEDGLRVPMQSLTSESEYMDAWMKAFWSFELRETRKTLVPYGDYLYFTDVSDGQEYLYRILISGQYLERMPFDEDGYVVQLIADEDGIYYRADYYLEEYEYDELGNVISSNVVYESALKKITFADGAVSDCLSLDYNASVLSGGGAWYISGSTDYKWITIVYDADFQQMNQSSDIILKSLGGETCEVMLVEKENGRLAILDNKALLTPNPAPQELEEITWESLRYSYGGESVTDEGYE